VNFLVNLFRMKVHLIKRQTLEDFVWLHPRAKSSIQDWLYKLAFSDWNQPGDIKLTYNTADLLGKSSNRVVFDIGGNTYRMICKYVFGARQVHLFICWVGTHSDYDKLCKQGTQYSVNFY